MTFVLRRGTAAAAASALALTSIALVVAAAAPAGAATTPTPATVTEYTVPSATYDIATDPIDGTFWSDEPSTGKIIHTNAAGMAIGAELTVPGATTGLRGIIATASDVYTVDAAADKIYDYTKPTSTNAGGFTTTSTRSAAGTLNAPTCLPAAATGPTDLVLGRNGIVYITTNTNGKIIKYDVTQHTIDPTDCYTPPNTAAIPAGTGLGGDTGGHAQTPFMIISQLNDVPATGSGASATAPLDGLYYTDNSGSTIDKVVFSQSTASPTFASATSTQIYQVPRNGATATNGQPQPYGISIGANADATRTLFFDYTSPAVTNTNDPGTDFVGAAPVAANGSVGTAIAANLRPVVNGTQSTTSLTPQDLVAGPDGFVYISENTASKIGRASYVAAVPANGSTAAVPAKIGPIGSISSGITTGAAPRGITLGNETPKKVWFAENGAARIASLNRTNATQAVVKSGTPQSAPAGSSYGAPLVATVLDPDGNYLPGISTTFTAPSSGPSVTFGSAGVTTQTVTSDTNGVATSATPFANTASGQFTVTAAPTANGFTGTAASYALTNKIGAAAKVTIVSGNNQSVQTGQSLAPLVVQVTDAGGNPVNSNPTVTFTAPGSGASLTFANKSPVETDSDTVGNGQITSSTPTANGTTGTYQVTVTITDANGNTVANTTPVSFTETNTGPPTAVVTVSGTPQTVKVSTAYAPLVVTVTDANGTKIANQMVTLTAPATGASGTFANGTATITVMTGPDGTVSVPFTANSTPSGNAGYKVTATSGNLTPTSFSLVQYGAPATVTLSAGQTVTAGGAFANAPTATVVDSAGTSVPNVVVTFTVPATAPTATFANGTNSNTTYTATTDATGVATASTLTAGTKSGMFQLMATAPTGSGTTVTAAPVTYTIKAGTATNIVVTPGTPSSSGQMTQVGTAYATNLSATVTDANGNPVVGDTVTFTVPGATMPATASGTFVMGMNTTNTVMATTNASGVATATTLTANTKAGTFTATATDTAITLTANQSVSYTLTNKAGAATAISKNPTTDNTSAAVNTAFTPSPGVTVVDANGNPVSGVTVTFTAPAASTTVASGTFGTGSAAKATATAVTGADGVATAPTLTADSKAGMWSLTASFTPATGSAQTVTFMLTNTAGTPTAVTATTGNNQHGVINMPYATNLVVTVTDASGNPVGGASVTFTAPTTTTGPTGTFADGTATFTGKTGADGTLTASTFTANGMTGSFSVTAAVTGATSATFTLTNDATDTANTVTASPASQATLVNQAFGSPLQVTVVGTSGKPLAGQLVTFTLPANVGTFASSTGSGAGTMTATAMTDSNGVATSPIVTAGNTPGKYTATATVGSKTGSFTLTVMKNPIQKTPPSIAQARKKVPVSGERRSSARSGKVASGHPY